MWDTQHLWRAPKSSSEHLLVNEQTMLLWALSYEFPDWVGEWAVIQTQRSPLRKRLWWFLQAGSPGGTAGPWRGELIPLCHNLQLMSAPRLSSLSLCLCSFVSKTVPMYRHTIICQGCIAESHTQIGVFIQSHRGATRSLEQWLLRSQHLPKVQLPPSTSHTGYSDCEFLS